MTDKYKVYLEGVFPLRWVDEIEEALENRFVAYNFSYERKGLNMSSDEYSICQNQSLMFTKYRNPQSLNLSSQESEKLLLEDLQRQVKELTMLSTDLLKAVKESQTDQSSSTNNLSDTEAFLAILLIIFIIVMNLFIWGIL